LGDVGLNVREIDECALGEPYFHRGRGSSLPVPHDSSQRRTFS
jgi:hypothetical protein